MRKIGRFAVALLAAGMIGTVSQSIGQPATAQAAAKVKVVWNKKTGQQTLKVKSSAKGYVYTSRLKHKVLKLSNYKKTTFYSSRSAKLKVNGSNRLYYYVTNSSNKKSRLGLERLFNTAVIFKFVSRLIKETNAYFDEHFADVN
ncbi:hypothetical protein [Secundilactobacillus kimchicus]|uniref:hypothetical protein n=1 Tax=Secundilactobacillus kimchicus TaxID=528209 RepID=UPI0006D10E4F|nr:hypothetical protein [Secundilactobacillus kimchicus]